MSAGVVYLIHFDRPYRRHARHYIGWTKGSLEKRLRLHRQGQGSRLMAVVTAAGIGWQLARTWEGGRRRERQIKKQGGASRCCPLCGVRPRTPAAGMPASGTPAEPARPAARSAGMTATAGRRGTAPSCYAMGDTSRLIDTGRPVGKRGRRRQSIGLVMTCMTSVYGLAGSGTAPACRRTEPCQAGHDGTLASTRITRCTEARKAPQTRTAPRRTPYPAQPHTRRPALRTNGLAAVIAKHRTRHPHERGALPWALT